MLTPNNATPNSKPIVKDHPHQRLGKWYALVEIDSDPTATEQEVRTAICDNLMNEGEGNLLQSAAVLILAVSPGQ